MTGTMPGVLLRVIRRWRRGVLFNARLVVGFRASIIEGASVIRWMVNMGASSITLCSSARGRRQPPSVRPQVAADPESI